jgi:cytochrome P450
MPAFSYRHIKDLYPTFWSKSREVTEAMTAVINTKSEGDEDSSVVEIGSWASRVTLDIIGVAGMGHDFNAIKDPNSELNQCYRAIFQATTAARILQFLGFLIPMNILTLLPLKRNRDVNNARTLIRKVCLKLIVDKKEKMEKGAATDKDILSVAIESGGFSDDDLVNQLMTFLAAGHETTASAMMWACYLLCTHPEIQKKLRDDIRANLPSIGDENFTATAADVDKCAYLHAVCNEVLRFFPSVPMTIRIAAHDTTILDHPIPKNTTIIISPWAINVNKELWGPDADEFNPDRWMGQGVANTGGADSNYSFLTFLHGPRSCIGQAFAKAEFACLVAAWVGRFEMEFADKDYELKIGGGITSKPKGGLKVRLSAVEGW